MDDAPWLTPQVERAIDAIARKRGFRGPDAEDFRGEVLYKLVKYVPRHDEARMSLTQATRRLMENVAIDFLRKKQRRVGAASLDALTDEETGDEQAAESVAELAAPNALDLESIVAQEAMLEAVQDALIDGPRLGGLLEQMEEDGFSRDDCEAIIEARGEATGQLSLFGVSQSELFEITQRMAIYVLGRYLGEYDDCEGNRFGRAVVLSVLNTQDADSSEAREGEVPDGRTVG